ncbi:MAG: hypothetical protein Q8P23_01940 [bacterium]|nr:hypothetical protein [bacterium]
MVTTALRKEAHEMNNAELLAEARRVAYNGIPYDGWREHSVRLTDALAASDDEVFIQTEARNELRDALRVERARLARARERNRVLVEAIQVCRDWLSMEARVYYGVHGDKLPSDAIEAALAADAKAGGAT